MNKTIIIATMMLLLTTSAFADNLIKAEVGYTKYVKDNKQLLEYAKSQQKDDVVVCVGSLKNATCLIYKKPINIDKLYKPLKGNEAMLFI